MAKHAVPAPARTRIECRECHGVTVYTLDPFARTLEVSVPERRCRYCYPGGATRGERTDAPAVRIEALWQDASFTGVAGFAWRELSTGDSRDRDANGRARSNGRRD